MRDTTDRPSHYTAGATEAADVIRDTLGEAWPAYCHGSALKYLLRAGKKGGKFAEDMKKASNYALWAAGIDWRETATKESEV